MKRIAIVACENSNTVCAGCACLNAFYDRRKSFERYAGEELRLMAFMRCSHCVKDGDPMQDAGFVEKLEALSARAWKSSISVCAADARRKPHAPAWRKWRQPSVKRV